MRRGDRSVTVYERNDRVGKKILATGNGKCNFSNRQMSMEQYYGTDLSIPAKILKDFTPEDAVRFFERAGMLNRRKTGIFIRIRNRHPLCWIFSVSS